MAKIIKEEEFMDEGLPYIRQTFDDGRRHIIQKEGVSYPIVPPVSTDKENYQKLSTNTEKVDFIAQKLNLD